MALALRNERSLRSTVHGLTASPIDGPRTGAFLHQMAASHEEWARREDDQSENVWDDS